MSPCQKKLLLSRNLSKKENKELEDRDTKELKLKLETK